MVARKQNKSQVFIVDKHSVLTLCSYKYVYWMRILLLTSYGSCCCTVCSLFVLFVQHKRKHLSYWQKLKFDFQVISIFSIFRILSHHQNEETMMIVATRHACTRQYFSPPSPLIHSYLFRNNHKTARTDKTPGTPLLHLLWGHWRKKIPAHFFP